MVSLFNRPCIVLLVEEKKTTVYQMDCLSLGNELVEPRM
jgi:hypothetical protein